MKRTVIILAAVVLAALLALPACGKKKYKEDYKKDSKAGGSRVVTPSGSAAVAGNTTQPAWLPIVTPPYDSWRRDRQAPIAE